MNLPRRWSLTVGLWRRICAAHRFAVVLGFAWLTVTGAAAERMTPDEEGSALAAEVRAQRPERDLTTAGVLRSRDPNGRWAEAVPVRMEVVCHPDYWQSRYLALTTNQVPMETLTVTHSERGANRYDHSRATGTAGGSSNAVTLTGDAATVSFAGSEFWLADLGLEFLQWPQQRVLKHEMRKGRSCKVLESVNPHPTATSYERVLSWIDIEHRGILRAEAYDLDRKLVKEFSIGGFKKVDGRWQLKSMEIRDGRTDARTRLEFDLEFEDRSDPARPAEAPAAR